MSEDFSIHNYLLYVKYRLEDFLLFMQTQLPTLYDLYMITLIIVLAAGFYQIILLNKKYESLYVMFAKIIDRVL